MLYILFYVLLFHLLYHYYSSVSIDVFLQGSVGLHVIFILSTNVEAYNPLLEYKVCFSTGTHIPESFVLLRLPGVIFFSVFKQEEIEKDSWSKKKK